MIDPEIGFTSDVIRDPARFIGRTELLSDCIRAPNSPLGLIAIYGKRGVGKSSLLRQIQQMALGDYELAGKAGLKGLVPKRPRTYLTVFYTCDSMITSGAELLSRLCNDNDIRSGAAFPTLESQYQRAIGNSEHRQLLLHLLAEQPEDNAMFNDEVGRVVLKSIRADAQGLGVEFIDQLMPRLVDPSFGPVLVRLEDRQGIYEFANPVFRVYVKLRKI